MARPAPPERSRSARSSHQFSRFYHSINLDRVFGTHRTAFARFPTWMWRNNEVRDFVSWLRKHNGTVERSKRVAFHGLDLYSLYDSIRSVLNYLDEVDPGSAKVARERYGCLTPWQRDPATYGHAAPTGSYPTCEKHVVRTLTDLLDKRRA